MLFYWEHHRSLLRYSFFLQEASKLPSGGSKEIVARCVEKFLDITIQDLMKLECFGESFYGAYTFYNNHKISNTLTH